VRDLPWGEQQVYLQVNRRQFRCQHCKKVFSEEFELVKKKRNYTQRFQEKLVKEVLESDLKSVAKRNGVSEQELETMLKELGSDLKSEKPLDLKVLGFDEISVVKGQGNYYVIGVNLVTKKIVAILKKRTQSEIEEYLKSWGAEVLSQIEEVSMDLWKPDKNVVEKLMPQAEIVADRFHVMKQVNEELDRARKEMKKAADNLKDAAEKELILSGLKKSKYALLKNQEDLTEKQIIKLKEIEQVAPELKRKHQLKEKFREVFEKSQDGVEGLFSLSDWLKDAALDFPESCATIRRWIGEIIGYFENRTTQGVVAGINNKLKLIKRKAYGFRNFDNFQLRVLLTWRFSS
jgi:transposase